MRRDYTLDDKYTLETGSAYLTGIQALVRLPLEQMRRDRAAGRRTGCFISGYEGSPLGGYDLALQRVAGLLAEHNVRFVPGVNEDLAATAVAGSQMAADFPDPAFEGVVGIWYGKGPGVDRSGDALRHANLTGTGRLSGALALAGDDHVSKSSTIPHQSEWSLYNVGIPVLAAGSTQEILDLGLAGIALSRFAGVWCALKLATDVCDGGGMVEFSQDRPRLVEPEFEAGGRPWRASQYPLLIAPRSLDAERELYALRLEAARAFAWANGLNRIVRRGANDRFGIVSCGKAYYDLRSALRDLGLDDAALEAAGVRILHLGMTFPLEQRIVDEFADGLDTVLVVEEKRSFVEMQLREMLYNRANRPAIHGKLGPDGEELLPTHGELDAETVARALGRWFGGSPAAAARLRRLDEIAARTPEAAPLPARTATYCSGCPHNRSTIVLDGQIAGGGIGCHGMAARLPHAGRGVAWLAHMGSEGGHWIGLSPFTGRKHIFQNLGDGTYFHSGRQGVQAAAQAGVNITFKLLHNGVVAMTGGQDAAGAVGIPAMTRQMEADGVRKIVLLSDDPEKYAEREGLAENVDLRPREDLEDALRELEKEPGTTALIYDQMCAAEKRRRRGRRLLPQPVRRPMIHERVCEGCGDCVRKSNCVSLEPVETEYGPKTRIHQSSCNVDASCLLGECPSFVTVDLAPGTGLKRRPPNESEPPEVPAPALPADWREPYSVLMCGIGGTGVVTVNAVLATAALIDGLSVSTLDQTGLAQKGGAVVSHLLLARGPIETANRVGYGAADLLLGFDGLGAANPANLVRTDPERTAAVVNSRVTPTSEAVRTGLTVLAPEAALRAAIGRSTRAENNLYLDATRLAESLFGSHLQTNFVLAGAAWQRGLLPISLEALESAIRLNGVGAEANWRAFGWGRACAHDLAAAWRAAGLAPEEHVSKAQSLDERIAARAAELERYQDAACAAGYREFVERVRLAERRAWPGSEALARAVADNLFKLTAYKDEYEVARLLTDGSIEAAAAATFERPRRVVYQLHPPLLRRFGFHRKLALGPWFKPVLRVVASFRALRGTPFDPFGRLPSRRLERELIGWYRATVESLLPALEAGRLDEAVEIARLPERVRGYESVKEASARAAMAEAEERLSRLARRVAA